MKLKHIILFAILLIACTSNNLATDKQKNWCYSKALMILDDENLYDTYYDAHDLYRAEQGLEPINAFYSNVLFRNNLAVNDKEELRICKIWADINDIE